MKAQDVMTSNVVTVTPETSVRDVAKLMVERRISGVPVVGADGKLVGIVSESDLLHRTEIATERRSKWWLRMFEGPDQAARDYIKSHGLTVNDIMSRKLVTVSKEAELSEVADQFEKMRVKRLPVVEGGRLVGLITRGDLVRALVTYPVTMSAGPMDDEALRAAAMARIGALNWLDSTHINVSVEGGVAKVWGLVDSDAQREAVRIAVEETTGVKRVDNQVKLNIARTALT